MTDWKHLWQRLSETRVLHNFGYMASLNVASALISVLVYPYVIRAIGIETMGTYALLLAVAMYLQDAMDYGFNTPATKEASLKSHDPEALNRLVSKVYLCKMLLTAVTLLVALPAMLCIEFLSSHKVLFMLLLMQVLHAVYFPQWYYQGTKNMRFATLLQLGMRLVQLPLIVLLVHTSDDVNRYAAITGGTMLVSCVAAAMHLYKLGRRWRWATWSEVKGLFKEATPFFFAEVSVTLKNRSVTTLIGIFLGVREVAIYDLAQRIVQLPNLVIGSINKALFPEVMTNASSQRIGLILSYERKIGIGCMLLLALLGYPAVWLLGGKAMSDAYGVLLILTVTIYAGLIAGAYMQFCFIPQGRYSLIVRNRLWALASTLVLMVAGLWLLPSSMIAATALSVSGLIEVAYCRAKAQVTGD